jgi:Contractile injection system tube protein
VTSRRTPLTLTRLNVSQDGTVSVDRSKTFTAMLNPSDYKHTRAITYNQDEALGQIGSESKFSAVGPDKVSFSLLFDGTGAVPPSTPAEANKEVITHLNDLNNVIYKYDGQKHEPSHVRILWGTLTMDARLESMSTHYSLFKPSGEPLRAKVELGFVSFITKKEAGLMANRSSPDLTHRVLVKAGDTLPLLCHRIYGDSRYYPEVARHNGLREFRRLPPGLQLHFPPLVQP